MLLKHRHRSLLPHTALMRLLAVLVLALEGAHHVQEFWDRTRNHCHVAMDLRKLQHRKVHGVAGLLPNPPRSPRDHPMEAAKLHPSWRANGWMQRKALHTQPQLHEGVCVWFWTLVSTQSHAHVALRLIESCLSKSWSCQLQHLRQCFNQQTLDKLLWCIQCGPGARRGTIYVLP